jgi:hypothetical protein
MTGHQVIVEFAEYFLNKDDLRYGRRTKTLKYTIIKTDYYKGCFHNSIQYKRSDVERWLKRTGRKIERL